MPAQQRILIVDDDPDHLKIYGWVLNTAGFLALPCLVGSHGVDLPREASVDLVILDYTLHTSATTEEVARQILAAYPSAPIVLLSDIYGVPDDVAPLVTEFVRKGEPQRLLSTVSRLLEPKPQPVA